MVSVASVLVVRVVIAVSALIDVPGGIGVFDGSSLCVSLLVVAVLPCLLFVMSLQC